MKTRLVSSDIEYEMENHSLTRHTIPQLVGFLDALEDMETRNKIADIPEDEIKSNREYLESLKVLLRGQEIYRFLFKTLQKKVGILFIINKEIPEFKRSTRLFSGVEIRI